jgi:hypothetical protein
MSVQLDLWQLVSLLLGFFGFAGAAFKMLARQYERRLDEHFSSERLAREEGAKLLREKIASHTAQGEQAFRQLQRLERDFLEWKAEMPVQYVRREDYIRGQAVLEAKLDALYSKLELVQIKGARMEATQNGGE